jgi:hypothetical protein
MIEDLEARTSKPNWDDAGAAPIPRSLWAKARGLSQEVGRALPRLPAPFFSPSADGTVVVSWTISKTREVCVEIERDPSAHYAWLMCDTDGLFEHGWTVSAAGVVEILTICGAPA